MSELTRLINEIILEGIKKVENADKENCQSRLDYIIEQNPTIDKDRISTPPELHLANHIIGSSAYRKKFFSAFMFLGAGYVLNSILADSSHTDKVIHFLPALNYGIGIVEFISGVISQYTFNKSPYAEPLSEKEIALSNYVFMKDTKNAN